MRAQTDGLDVVVVGGGPNGLAAAITCARAGLRVRLVEARSTLGGGARTANLTLPGFAHDVCSAVHPLALSSPFFRELPLADFGLEWVYPQIELAHPLDDGRCAALYRSVEATASAFGLDGPAYERIFSPFARRAKDLYDDVLAPLHFPRHPALFARFGLAAMRAATGFARTHFREDPARALMAGCGAHSFQPLEAPFSAAFCLVLAISGHSAGWPFPRGGSRRIVDVLAAIFRALGGEVETDCMVTSMDELPPARAYIFDVLPHALADIAGNRLPSGYRDALRRYRHSNGVFKVDWALNGPIPWRATEARAAGTVHVGGTMDEVAASERAVAAGEHSERPFVLLAQQSLFDSTRAPPGLHTGWAYCHVPFASTVDMTERIEAQIERFAPGFRDCILAKHTMGPAEYEKYNPNNVGGDIAGGATDVTQLFARPMARLVPYATPAEDIYICSSATPPGGGVHGMCGLFAAVAALGRVFGMRRPTAARSRS